MSATFAIPFGPTFNPLYEPEGGFFWDDFVAYSASGTADVTPWVDVSTTGTEVASAAEPWGAVAIGSGAFAAGDGGIELNGEPFAFDHTKDIMFVCRFKISSLTGSDIFVGLHTEAFDVNSGSLVSTHIGFTALHTASLLFTVADGTTQTTQDTTYDLVADTYIIAVWKFNAATGVIRFYVNGDLKGTMSIADDTPPASGTQLTLGLHTEYVAAATTLTCDYVGVAGER